MLASLARRLGHAVSAILVRTQCGRWGRNKQVLTPFALGGAGSLSLAQEVAGSLSLARGGLAVARGERGSGLASLAHAGERARCRSHMCLRSEVKRRLAPCAVSPDKLPQEAPHDPRAHVWLRHRAEVDRSSLRSAWVSPCDVRT